MSQDGRGRWHYNFTTKPKRRHRSLEDILFRGSLTSFDDMEELHKVVEGLPENEEPQIPEPPVQAESIGGLVYAVSGAIYLHRPDESDIQIASREGRVLALCFHDERLYDSGDYCKIVDTLANREVAGRDGSVWALCSHEGRLYDGGYYHKVFDTLANKEIATRANWVWALCSHEGRLYDSGTYTKVFDTLANSEIARRVGWVSALCSHENSLFDGGTYNRVFDTINNKAIAWRTDWVRALCSHDGRLLDGGNYRKILDTLSGKKLRQLEGECAAMCSIDQALVDEILKNAPQLRVRESLDQISGGAPKACLKYRLLRIPTTMDELVDYAKRAGIKDIGVEIETRCLANWGTEWWENDLLVSAGNRCIRILKAYVSPNRWCDAWGSQETDSWINAFDSLLGAYTFLEREGFNITIEGKTSEAIQTKLDDAARTLAENYSFIGNARWPP